MMLETLSSRGFTYMRRLISLLLASALLAACAGNGGGPDPAENPKEALISALRSLNEAGLEVVIDLQTDQESLVALSSDGGSEPLTAEEADKIIESALTMRTTKEEDPMDSDAEFIADIAGHEAAVEIKAVDQNLYARADVQTLMEEFGQDPAQLEEIRAQGEGLSITEPALAGEWVGISNVDELSQQLTGGQAPTPDEATTEAFTEDMVTALENASEVTSEGEDDIGHHLVANVDVRELYTSFMDAIQKVSAGVPLGPLPDASEIPEGDLRLDVWVADDRVEQVVLDIIQIGETFSGESAPEGVDEFAVRMDVNEFDETIEAPEDATMLDPSQLMQMLLGGMGGGGSSGGTPAGGEDLCAQLEGAPAEVIEQFAEECPELQP